MAYFLRTCGYTMQVAWAQVSGGQNDLNRGPLHRFFASQAFCGILFVLNSSNSQGKLFFFQGCMEAHWIIYFAMQTKTKVILAHVSSLLISIMLSQFWFCILHFHKSKILCVCSFLKCYHWSDSSVTSPLRTIHRFQYQRLSAFQSLILFQLIYGGIIFFCLLPFVNNWVHIV